ncbi:MAG: diacylglycerol kinase [Actinomycetia bacterium]|nr:diacylglycerol kinase [Actinomycetes bacterium]
MQKPTIGQRALAASALLCGALLVVFICWVLFTHPVALVVAIIGLLGIGAGGWWLVTEPNMRRLIGIGILLVGLILVCSAALVTAIDLEGGLIQVVGVLVLTGAAMGQARLALVKALHSGVTELAPAPQRPVLIANPKSGGGKVGKFKVIEAAESAGVEVVVLAPGDDLEQLARDAIAHGADCLGMAGGDGSQALVASVAAEHDLPFVCISAGTRNHFALDLGLDRDDPSKGIIAFSEGIDRRVDYATVSGRAFVNNVSLGVYATIVEQGDYRDAKLATSKKLLPELLGPAEEPFDLQFTTPEGQAVAGASLILVSNNPYVLGPKLDVAQRRSLNTGTLGVLAIDVRSGADAAKLFARAAIGASRRDPHLFEFQTPRFEVRSESGRAALGVDGETLELPTPLLLVIHPNGLRLRLPVAAEAQEARKRSRNVNASTLLRVAAGKPIETPR